MILHVHVHVHVFCSLVVVCPLAGCALDPVYMYMYMYMYMYLVMTWSPVLPCRAKNNVRTTVNFRANDGKDRSNDYTSGHYDRPGEYSALIIYAIVRCPYGATAAIDRSIIRTYVRTYIYIYIYTSSIDASFPGSSLLPRNNFKKGGRSLGTKLRRVERVHAVFFRMRNSARAPRKEGSGRGTAHTECMCIMKLGEKII